MSDEKKERENKAAAPKRETKQAAGYRYLGGGFLPGIPARDLSADEAKAIGLKLLDNSPLYERVEEGA